MRNSKLETFEFVCSKYCILIIHVYISVYTTEDSSLISLLCMYSLFYELMLCPKSLVCFNLMFGRYLRSIHKTISNLQ